jgi:hypothetical protein
MMSYFSLIGSDSKGVVTNQTELVCGHMSNDAVLIEDYGEDIIAESTSVTDIHQHPVA